MFGYRESGGKSRENVKMLVTSDSDSELRSREIPRCCRDWLITFAYTRRRFSDQEWVGLGPHKGKKKLLLGFTFTYLHFYWEKKYGLFFNFYTPKITNNACNSKKLPFKYEKEVLISKKITHTHSFARFLNRKRLNLKITIYTSYTFILQRIFSPSFCSF